MDFAQIDVEIRTTTGKGAARKLRATGRVPAVLYGHQEQPMSLDLDPLALLRVMDKKKRRNTVFELQMDGGKTKIPAMVREAQINPLTSVIEHLDFLRVRPDETVTVTVPVILKGHPVGVVLGGILSHIVHDIAVSTRADNIPTFIEHDVSKLGLNQTVHVSDLVLGEGVTSVLSPKNPVAAIAGPRDIKDEKAEESGEKPAEKKEAK